MFIEIYAIINCIIKFMAILGPLAMEYIILHRPIKKACHRELGNISNLINESLTYIRY